MVHPIKIMRVQKNLRQKDLQKLSGVPQWRISLIERGLGAKKGEMERLLQALEEAPGQMSLPFVFKRLN